MGPAENRRDELREHAFGAAGGIEQGEQALVSVLRDIERAKGRAADSYRAVVRSLAAALEARDGYTGGHSDEVHDLALAVARRLELGRGQVDEIRTVALLHDIGKIGIPDGILHKQSKLDADDWALMREHPVIGERILRPLPGMSAVATAVRHEHERWDGDGYPDGLSGEAIPLSSRVVLACDAWHALVSDRPYRSALPRHEALAELRRCSGTQFDPAVVDALIACIEDPRPHEEDYDEVDDSLAAVLVPDDGGEESRLQAELRALITVAAAVAAVHRLEDVIETAAEEARRALDAGSLSICKLEVEHQQLRVLINVGELGPGEERSPEDELYNLADYPRAQRMFEAGKPHLVRVDDPAADRAECELLLGLGKVSAAAVPIVFADRVWGELYATRAAGDPPFNERDVRFLMTISGQVAMAIGRAEMFTRMAELAFEDYLTGLANRRALDERLEQAVAAAIADGDDLALVICDVDNLKLINDARGHQSGDAALIRVADVLRQTVADHPAALVARISGDEFCIVLERSDALAARIVAERALAVLTKSAPAEPVTLSAGIASIGTGARRPADLMRAADAALYTAKRTGRRRVYVARSEDARPEVAKPERRAELRARAAANLHRMLEDGIAQLDAIDGSPLERLGAVAGVVADAIDATAWLISHTDRGSRTIGALRGVDSREHRMSGVRFDRGMDLYDLGDYPATEAIQVSGGSFTVHVDDAVADAAERDLLMELGVLSVVAVAVHGTHGCWLTELYGDELTLDTRAAEPYLRLLCAEAVRGSARVGAPTA